MKIEVKIPEVGESVQEAVLAQWFRQDGDRVSKDEVLFVIETDKVTLEVAAEADGLLQIKVAEGETVPIGAVVGIIETEATLDEAPMESAKRSRRGSSETAPPKVSEGPKKAEKIPVSDESAEGESEIEPKPVKVEEDAKQTLSPSVRRIIDEKEVDVSKIVGTGPGGRITKSDVLLYLEKSGNDLGRESTAEVDASKMASAKAERKIGSEEETELTAEESVTRKTMTPIRRKIAERLLHARQNTAMLTTFNEIDMGKLQDIRRGFKELFREKYGVSIGLMSFFIKACVLALKEFPEVNAFIEDNDIVFHHYYHIGVAIGAERGLVVPVIRHADRLSFAQIEQTILDYVNKIKQNRLEISDLENGTFTISNGGVYGSLLSTPILNTPQSGILGMHKIEDRPVVVDGQIAIRPMMYVALSYDHRIVDGREAVSFLKHIKDCIENPERIMMEI